MEKAALELHQTDKAMMVEFLTNYSVSQGERVVKRWIELGEHLLTKYNDGYVKDEKGRPRAKGYPEDYLRQLLKLKPGQFKLPPWGDKKKGGRLD